MTTADKSIMWQPFWNGTCTKMAQIQAGFTSIQDNQGGVFSFALYADRGDLWPGALLKVLGDMVTTTTVANQALTITVDADLTPHTVYWLALMVKGIRPNVRTYISAHPLLGLPDTDFVRTTAPVYTYNYLYFVTTDGIFPAPAGDETVLTLMATQVPRLAWSGT